MTEWPCHKLPQEKWCDHSGPGGFMGHTCVETATARYEPNGKALSDREREILVILMEECAEVTQAASKLLRFGKENRPDSGESNIETLSKEAGDLRYLLKMARDAALIDTDTESKAQMRKRDKLRWFMQSKP